MRHPELPPITLTGLGRDLGRIGLRPGDTADRRAACVADALRQPDARVPPRRRVPEQRQPPHSGYGGPAAGAGGADQRLGRGGQGVGRQLGLRPKKEAPALAVRACLLVVSFLAEVPHARLTPIVHAHYFRVLRAVVWLGTSGFPFALPAPSGLYRAGRAP